jgi:hypothetical protein
MHRRNRYLAPAERNRENRELAASETVCSCCQNLGKYLGAELGALKRSAEATACPVCHVLYHGTRKIGQGLVEDCHPVGVWPRSCESETVTLRIYGYQPSPGEPGDLQTGDLMLRFYTLEQRGRKHIHHTSLRLTHCRHFTAVV